MIDFIVDFEFSAFNINYKGFVTMKKVTKKILKGLQLRKFQFLCKVVNEFI